MTDSELDQIPVGAVRFGDLRRLRPISDQWGYDRGTPIDRYYIERFLDQHRTDIRGRVLEVGDASYTRRFGDDRVTAIDVLHVRPGAPGATIVADLAHGEEIPSARFDCIILTQTLHLIFELSAAVATLRRILAPDGVLLATVPGISQLDRYEWNTSWYWSFTNHSVQRLLEPTFGPANTTVESYGNVLAAVAFLHGLSVGELRPDELNASDPCYQLIVAMRASKAAEEPGI